MTNERILDAIGGISESAVRDAKAYRRPGFRRRRRWAAAAACLCLAAAIAIPVLHHKGGTGREDPRHDIAALEFNGKYYEAVNLPKVLEKYGLPPEITADMAGAHLSYLKSDGGIGYRCTAGQTDIALYQYAPAACDGVYLLRDGETWYAALFCNFYRFDGSTNCPLTELYRVYGIESADDIASVAEMQQGNEQVIGSPVTNRREIAGFYDMTAALESYGNDDFQAEVFGGIPEEKQQEAHSAFAEDRRNLRIETKDGLRFFLAFYPGYDWMDGGGTLSYFKTDGPLRDWLARNFG